MKYTFPVIYMCDFDSFCLPQGNGNRQNFQHCIVFLYQVSSSFVIVELWNKFYAHRRKRHGKKNSSVGSFSINLLLISLNPGKKIFNMMGETLHFLHISGHVLIPTNCLESMMNSQLAFTRINLEYDNVHFSLFFGEILSISCNRKKCQCLCRTKVTYIKTCQITYNYQYAPRSSRLIFCLRLIIYLLLTYSKTLKQCKYD